jgi:hypothetical protein
VLCGVGGLPPPFIGKFSSFSNLFSKKGSYAKGDWETWRRMPMERHPGGWQAYLSSVICRQGNLAEVLRPWMMQLQQRSEHAKTASDIDQNGNQAKQAKGSKAHEAENNRTRKRRDIIDPARTASR